MRVAYLSFLGLRAGQATDSFGADRAGDLRGAQQHGLNVIESFESLLLAQDSQTTVTTVPCSQHAQGRP